MADYKVHRYFVKSADKQFVDRSTIGQTGNNISTFVSTDLSKWAKAEEETYLKYLEWVQTLPGVTGAKPTKSQIDENTYRYTHYCKAPEGKERSFAELFNKEIGTSSNTARKNFLLMMAQKGESANVALCYTQVEFANGQIVTLEKLTKKEEFVRAANNGIIVN